MQDNATIELLIRYMDGELNEAEKKATEKLLREDASLQEHYQYLIEAKRAIKSQGLKQRVQAIHQEYMQATNENKTGKPKADKHQSFFKVFMRIAAIFIIVIGSYGVFRYVSTTNQSVYNDNFISYQLPVNRGVGKADSLDALYKTGDYHAIINAFDGRGSKNQKDYFLAAQAYLQLNNADAAINAFQQVEHLNNKSAEKYFAQETDYYLMLAYIKAGKIEAAEKLLNKITSNKQHLFYNNAKNISRIKLTMLKWKE
jgi:tetratricopeptide (TPR) repeat protein